MNVPEPPQAAPAGATRLPVTEAGGCQCGADHDEVVLDARQIPHAIRHGAILGSVDQLRPGTSMVLVAPHDPLPLLVQMRDRFGESVDVEYVLREPAEVRLRLTKAAAAL
jgi:uncharacterized protein (DUF2249 family)